MQNIVIMDGWLSLKNLGTKAVAKARKRIAREMWRSGRHEIIVLANVGQVEKSIPSFT